MLEIKKNTRKRLSLKKQFELIEDSLKPGFKQSQATLKCRVSPVYVNGWIRVHDLVKVCDLVNFFSSSIVFTILSSYFSMKLSLI